MITTPEQREELEREEWKLTTEEEQYERWDGNDGTFLIRHNSFAVCSGGRNFYPLSALTRAAAILGIGKEG